MASGAAWAAGIASALQGYQQGAQQKQDRQQDKLTKLATVQAQEYGDLYARAINQPTAENQQAAADAHKAYTKSLKDLEKSYGGGDKTVLGKIQSQLVSIAQQHGLKGGKHGAAPGAAPTPAPPGQSYEQFMGNKAQLQNDITQKQGENTLAGLGDEQSKRAAKQDAAAVWAAVTGGPNNGPKSMTPGEGLSRFMDDAAKAAPEDPTAPFTAGMNFIDHGVTAGHFKMTPELQTAYDRLKTRAVKPGAQKYPTGTVAKMFVDAGVGLKPIDQMTQEDWNQVASFSRQQREEAAQERKRRDANASASHDHRYQQFQAQTAGDRAMITKNESRIGQLEGLLGNVMNTLSPEDRAARLSELTAAQVDLARRNKNMSDAYDQIYKGAKAAPSGATGVSTPASEPVGDAGSGEPKASSQFGSGLDQISQ